MGTIRGFFEDAVRESGDSAFLREHDGEGWRTLSYAQSKARVLRLLAGFLKLGLSAARSSGERTRVALMRENGSDWILSYLALAGCGFVVVPVDPHLRASEAAHILTDSESAFVLADDALEAILAEAATPARTVLASAFSGVLGKLAEDDLAAAVRFWDTHQPQRIWPLSSTLPARRDARKGPC